MKAVWEGPVDTAAFPIRTHRHACRRGTEPRVFTYGRADQKITENPAGTVAQALVLAVPALSRNLGANRWKEEVPEVAPALLRAASPLSRNLGANCWKEEVPEVAHALL